MRRISQVCEVSKRRHLAVQYSSFFKRLLSGLVLLCVVLACTPDDRAPTPGEPPDEPPSEDQSAPNDPSEPGQPCDAPEEPHSIPESTLWIRVTLDGHSQSGIRVMQGGSASSSTTDCQGNALVPYTIRDRSSGPTFIASFPTARIKALEFETVPPNQGPHDIALESYATSDNPRYQFQHPGTPTDRGNTTRCGHCHESINDAWYESVHKQSASNPKVHDHYAGTNSRLTNQEDCETQGGAWKASQMPGETEIGYRCYVTNGAFQIANPGCETTLDCDSSANFAGCADCHAPGINGQLGGRNLLDAQGSAFEFGVHCDVCHRVNSVGGLEQPAGVAGRLVLLRPSERSPSQALGTWYPLTFGPRHDVPNPRMGSVQRDHYQNGKICSGCHEFEQEALSPNETISQDRWPSGTIPIQSTFSEWERSPMGGKVACNSCHMPPNPTIGNSSQIESQPSNKEGISAGFVRPTGSVRHHSWIGPRTAGGRMLELSATLSLTAERSSEHWNVSIITKNVGPGHAIPTGEPSRHLLLEVQADCDGSDLPVLGGDVVPDYGGYSYRFESRQALSDLAQVDGMKVRSIRRGAVQDYDGIPPFHLGGRFEPEEKHLYSDTLIAESLLTRDETGTLRWVPDIPDASFYYVITPEHGRALAGSAGFGFARVTLGSSGERYVPHYKAIDIASDNRLAPNQSWRSIHQFDANCENPTFDAILTYRDKPDKLGTSVRMERFRTSNGTVEMELESMKPWRFIIILCVSACVHETPQEAQIPFASQVSPLILEPTESGILEIELQASQLENPQNPLLKYGFNQMSPGPVLLAPVGTELVATLVNQLEMPTTLHWHGAGAPNTMDGTPRVQDPVLPGETFQYEFTLSNPGTFWYHPHFDTARQVDLGLYGMLIVYEPSEPQPDERLVLVFDSAAENQPREMIDDHRHIDGHGMHWLINGSTKDTFEVSSGAVVRAHLLNASNAGYLYLNSEGMRVIAHDQGYQGTVHDGPLVLGPGDRAEVEWLPGADPILVDHRPFSLNGGVTYMPEETLFSLVPLGDAPAAPPSEMPVSTPEYKDHWAAKSADFTYVFHGDSRTNSWMLNGESFPDVTPFRTNVGREVIIEVRNLSSTNHPFHTHGHPFKVVSRNGNPVDPRNLQDTIDVAIFETMRLVVNTYNPGEWMVHCHILPHAYAGMMTYMIVE